MKPEIRTCLRRFPTFCVNTSTHDEKCNVWTWTDISISIRDVYICRSHCICIPGLLFTWVTTSLLRLYSNREPNCIRTRNWTYTTSLSSSWRLPNKSKLSPTMSFPLRWPHTTGTRTALTYTHTTRSR